MRLSDAIALGRTLLISTPHTRFNGDGGGCALGMAEVAIGVDHQQIEEYEWIEIHPEFVWMNNRCNLPCGCSRIGIYAVSDNVSCAIAHVFNEHIHGKQDWTLDQLIDWVRSVEPAEPVPAIAEGEMASELCETVQGKGHRGK